VKAARGRALEYILAKAANNVPENSPMEDLQTLRTALEPECTSKSILLNSPNGRIHSAVFDGACKEGVKYHSFIKILRTQTAYHNIVEG